MTARSSKSAVQRLVASARHQLDGAAPGVAARKVAEVPSRIPGFTTVRLVEVTWEPGAKVGPETMEFPMVCEMSRGVLDGTKNGEPVTRKASDVWTCAVRDVDVDINNGTEPATMRIFMLVPA